MKYLLPIAAMLCTAFCTLVMLVFLLAGMANSSPEQLRSMQLWVAGLCLLSLVCVVAGIVLMRRDRPGAAALVAFLPTAVMGCIFVLLLL